MPLLSESSSADQQTPNTLAPVVVFAYARADHLRRTVASLQANSEAPLTDIIFFCDAAKRPEHQARVDEVRSVVDAVSGFRSVTRIYRELNMGLAQSIVEGVGQVLAARGNVIVLEDDLMLSPYFLRYMNDALARYQHDERVASIHGYIYPVGVPLPETFFLEGADCWGWATWPRAWAQFDGNGEKLLAELCARGLCRQFDFDGQYSYTDMLRDQIAGRNNSWAILWHASCYLKGLLTLYPGRSLVENIGNDASGTHCISTDALSRPPTPLPVPVHAIKVEPSAAAREAVVRFFAGQRPWQSRLRGAMKAILRGQR